MLGFDGFEIVYCDDGLVARPSLRADEKSAGFQAPPGKRLKSFPNRHSEAAYHIQAEPDGYRFAWDFPDQPAVADGWRIADSIFHDESSPYVRRLPRPGAEYTPNSEAAGS